MRKRNWNRSTELLLVVSHWKSDLTWLITQMEFPCVIGRKGDNGAICDVPVNKGAEGSTYLKFILNNWKCLPERVCFLDDHEYSWHQPFNMIHKLTALRDSGLPQEFYPLNDLVIDSNQKFRHWKYELFSQVWDAVVKPHLKMECPRRIVADGSAQFIVSREVILSNPRILYEDLYHYTIGSKRWRGDYNWKDASGFSYSPGGQNWVGGNHFLEWIWHIIFGQPAILPIHSHFV